VTNPSSSGTSKFDFPGNCGHWRAPPRACQDTGRQGHFPGLSTGSDLRVDSHCSRPGSCDPATRYEYELPIPSDIARALELDAKFGELGLGLVDGTVAAIAERRRGYRVLTTDRRDFGAIRVGPRLARALELLP
jgi:hypothetical protein